jgi:hypothetical protein
MPKFPVPPVPDLARAEGATVEEMLRWWLVYYNIDPVPWNYRCGTRIIRKAYQGLHNLRSLVAGCDAEKIEQSRKSNAEVVTLAAPLAFGRDTKVFDLPRQRFPFGHDLSSAYRIPFFFVENRQVKLYYLQPRKHAGLSLDQLAMVATIYRRFLLDHFFYGQAADVEFVDLAEDSATKSRQVRRYSLADLELWSEQRLQDRLTLIAESLRAVWDSGLITPRERRVHRPDPEMPLFD